MTAEFTKGKRYGDGGVHLAPTESYLVIETPRASKKTDRRVLDYDPYLNTIWLVMHLFVALAFVRQIRARGFEGVVRDCSRNCAR